MRSWARPAGLLLRAGRAQRVLRSACGTPPRLGLSARSVDAGQAAPLPLSAELWGGSRRSHCASERSLSSRPPTAELSPAGDTRWVL